jgi:hypothetical protein
MLRVAGMPGDGKVHYRSESIPGPDDGASAGAGFTVTLDCGEARRNYFPDFGVQTAC